MLQNIVAIWISIQMLLHGKETQQGQKLHTFQDPLIFVVVKPEPVEHLYQHRRLKDQSKVKSGGWGGID